MFSERGLIETILAPLTTSGSGALGLTDDAAFIRPQPGHDLVITQDSLQAGVHFFAADPLHQVAQKALRVNLSDLYAKGAEPQHYLLSLFIPPEMGEAELKIFAAGLAADQDSYGIALLGGDTVRTQGPFSLTVTMSGVVKQGRMIRRSGAGAGDVVFVSGTIGDAVLGLKILNLELDVSPDKHKDYLISTYRLPRPPSGLGKALGKYASAAMDISDGLAGDLNLLSRASGVRAVIDCAALPFSKAAQAQLTRDPDLLAALITGGDDYQILCTVPKEAAQGFEIACNGAMTRIGRIEAGQGEPHFTAEDGSVLELEKLSYAHF